MCQSRSVVVGVAVVVVVVVEQDLRGRAMGHWGAERRERPDLGDTALCTDALRASC